jgi:hypothetical protein
MNLTKNTRVFTKEEALNLRELNGKVAVSSLWISEQTNNNHYNLMKKIKKMFKNINRADEVLIESVTKSNEVNFYSVKNVTKSNELNFQPVKSDNKQSFVYYYKDSKGELRPFYIFPELEANFVIASFNDKYRYKLMQDIETYKKYIKTDVKQLKDELNQTKEQLEDTVMRLSKAEEVLHLRTNKYDKNDEFMTVRYFLNTNLHLKKKFTEKNILDKLEDLGYVKTIKKTTYIREIIPTKHSKYAPPNEETNTKSNIFTPYALNQAILKAYKDKSFRKNTFKDKPTGLELHYIDIVKQNYTNNQLLEFKNKKYHWLEIPKQLFTNNNLLINIKDKGG